MTAWLFASQELKVFAQIKNALKAYRKHLQHAKMSIAKKPIAETLKNAEECVIIFLGRRLSGCIGSAVTLSVQSYRIGVRWLAFFIIIPHFPKFVNMFYTNIGVGYLAW